jgi:hypothetical protein
VKELQDHHIQLNQYIRKYVPNEDVNGQPIVLIRFFCARDCYCGEFNDWKERLGQGKIYEGVKCVYRMKINLKTKEYSDLMFGGYG